MYKPSRTERQKLILACDQLSSSVLVTAAHDSGVMAEICQSHVQSLKLFAELALSVLRSCALPGTNFNNGRTSTSRVLTAVPYSGSSSVNQR